MTPINWIVAIIFTISPLLLWADPLCGQVVGKVVQQIQFEISELQSMRRSALESKDFSLSRLLESQIDLKIRELERNGVSFLLKENGNFKKVKNSQQESVEREIENRIVKSIVPLSNNFSRVYYKGNETIQFGVEGKTELESVAVNLRTREKFLPPISSGNWILLDHLEIKSQNGFIEITDKKLKKSIKHEGTWEINSAVLQGSYLKMSVSSSRMSPSRSVLYNIKSGKLYFRDEKIYAANEDFSFWIELTGPAGSIAKMHFERGQSPLNDLIVHFMDLHYLEKLNLFVYKDTNQNKVSVFDTISGKLLYEVEGKKEFQILDDRWLQVSEKLSNGSDYEIFELMTGKKQMTVTKPILIDASQLIDTQVFGADTIGVNSEGAFRVVDIQSKKVLKQFAIDGEVIFASENMLITQNDKKRSVFSIPLNRFLVKDAHELSIKIPMNRQRERNREIVVMFEWPDTGREVSFINTKTGATYMARTEHQVELIDGGSQYLLTAYSSNHVYLIDVRDLPSINRIVDR